MRHITNLTLTISYADDFTTNHSADFTHFKLLYSMFAVLLISVYNGVTCSNEINYKEPENNTSSNFLQDVLNLETGRIS